MRSLRILISVATSASEWFFVRSLALAATLTHRALFTACIALSFAAVSTHAAEPHSSLVIVIDGLRPDYITRELMPNLLALGEAGVIAEAHHAVFPTVTRVNSSSIATGTYPHAHGLLNNTIYLPAASPNPIDTGEAAALLAADAATGGQLLTAPSLGEVFARAGKKIFATGSGTTGSALLLNHKPTADSPVLSSRNFVRPESLRARAETVLGPPPSLAYPNRAANRWAIDAYLEIALKEFHPDVTLMWLTDPDGTAHRHGVGAPQTVEALRHIDEELGRLLATLTQRGLRERVNIFITADHGFSTHSGPFNLGALLTARGLAEGVKVVGGNQVYVSTGGEEKIRRIVRLLQETEWVGAIFTRAAAASSAEGFVPGTLSFDSIHYQHPRTADILVDSNWSNAPNAHGYPGTTTSSGVAGHGTSSPFDIRIRLTAAGPNVKRATRSSVPTGNIDLAVTLCHLHGVKPAPSMMGRALTELLREGPSPDSLRVERTVHRASADLAKGRYEVVLHKSRVGMTEYVDYTETKR
jgi:arylsulfatase A-like enzyme